MALQWRRKVPWSLTADTDRGQYQVNRFYGRGNVWEARWRGEVLNTYATQRLAKDACQDHYAELDEHRLGET